jgi:hypothetical protein
MALSINIETSLGVDDSSSLLPLDFEGVSFFVTNVFFESFSLTSSHFSLLSLSTFEQAALIGLPSSANIRIFSISSDGTIDKKIAPTILLPPVGSRITASNSSAQANALVMAVASSKAPQILLYGLRAGLPQLKTTLELPSPYDTAVSAVAISRDASRVAAFGSAPNFSLTIFELPSGAVCPGSETVHVPGLVTQASFCPGNPDLLAASGPGGLFFYNLKKSHDKLEAVLTRPQFISSGGSSIVTSSNSSSAAVAVVADDLDKVHSVFKEAAESIELNAAAAGLHPSAAAVASAAIIAKDGANVWLSMTWLSESYVAASNGVGELVVFNPNSGEVQARLNLSSRERMNGQVTSGSVIIATSMASTLRSLVVGCSDGFVRYLTLPLRTQGVSALSAESASFVSPISTNSSLFPLAAIVGLSGSPTDLLGNQTAVLETPSQPVSALAVSVSNPKHRAYAVTAGGTFHSIPMGNALASEISKQAEAATSMSSLSSANHTVRSSMIPSLFDYQSSLTISAVAINGVARSNGHTLSHFATADANGVIRIWASEGGEQVLITSSSLISSAISAPNAPVPTTLEDNSGDDDDSSAVAVVDIAGSATDGGGFFESKDGKEDEHPAVVAIDSVKASNDASAFSLIPDDSEKSHASSLSSLLSSSSSSSSPPLVITALASHPRLPLLAVGASDGSVSLVLVNSHSCTLVHRDFAHLSPVTSLLFGRNGETANLLVSVSATERVCVLHDVTAVGNRNNATSGAPTIARAVVCLPGSKSSQDAHYVSAVSIAGASQSNTSFDVYFGCESGHLLSISSDFAQIKQQGNGLIDLTSHLQIRGRMSSGIASLAIADKAVKGSTTAAVLFVALAGEKSVCALPLDSPWLAPHAITTTMLHDEQGAFEAVPSLLKPAAYIPAGKQSASSVLVSPSLHFSNSVVIASGSRNGTVSVALATTNSSPGSGKLDVSIVSSSTAFAHAGPVTSLSFSGNGRRLFSVAPAGDGMCGVLVLAGEPIDKAESALPKTNVDKLTAQEETLLSEINNIAPQQIVPRVAGFVLADHIATDGVDSQGKPVSVLTRLRALQEAASKAQHQQAHDALLGEVESFRARLRGLLAANASARPLERLDRREFVLDGIGRDRILAEFDKKVEQRKAAYQAECASLDADTKALRASCVDNLESPLTEIKSLTTDTTVKNFAVLKRVPADITEMERLATLRFVEIEAMEEDPSTEKVGGGSTKAFSGLLSYFPADIDWVYHAGLLAPSTDIAKQHEDILASKVPGAMKKLESNSDNASSDPSAAAAGAGDAPKEKKAKDGDEKEGPKSVQWQGENVKKLFYHPAVVRTSAQKRIQAKLIGELIRATQVKFNSSFDKLRHDKAEVIDAIKTRHARIRDILLELGTPVVHMTEKDQISQELQRLTGKSTAAAVAVFAGLSAQGALSADLTPAGRTPIGPVTVSGGDAGMQSITDPYLSPVEDPLTSLKVSDAEVGLSPYISPAEQRRRAEEEAKKKQAAAANKDDAPERALIDMMGGTLEGKNELDALADSLVREPWMDTVPLDQMTPEQKTALAAYNKLAAALEDERAKARNTLQTELTKLVGELKDIVDSFETKVSALVKTRTTTAAIIQAQEMYVAKLVSTARVREESAVLDKALVSQSDRLMPLEDASVQAHEAFKAHVEILQREVEALAAIDRSLENGFKSALKDADQTVDPDLFKVVLSLFRKRETVSTTAYAKEAAAALAAKTSEREAALQLLLPQNAPAKAAPKPITLARQPSLKGKDNFKGKGVDTALVSVSSAPLTLRPELDTDPYLYSTDASARAAEEEARQAAARDAIILPLQKADLPEGFEGLVNEPAGLFALVNTLRTQKIESEFALSAKTRVLDSMKAHLAFLAGRYEKHKNAIDSIQAARESILHKRELGLNDIDLLLRLRMGQDEVSANNYDCTPHPQGGAPEVDWTHAILGPADLVEVINGDVRKLGQVKVDSLTDIKTFRKGLIYQKWEQTYRRARADDEDEFHRDLQLMRAVGSVREFITGVNIQLKARQEVDRVEQKIAHLKKSHERALSLTEKATAKLESAIEQRKKAMASLARQTVQLKEGVALREAILRSRGVGVTAPPPTSGGAAGTTASKPPTNPNDEKMKTVALHGKLHAVAKEQSLEIAALRKELARALERSFPSWTQAIGK